MKQNGTGINWNIRSVQSDLFWNLSLKVFKNKMKFQKAWIVGRWPSPLGKVGKGPLAFMQKVCLTKLLKLKDAGCRQSQQMPSGNRSPILQERIIIVFTIINCIQVS